MYDPLYRVDSVSFPSKLIVAFCKAPLLIFLQVTNLKENLAGKTAALESTKRILEETKEQLHKSNASGEELGSQNQKVGWSSYYKIFILLYDLYNIIRPNTRYYVYYSSTWNHYKQLRGRDTGRLLNINHCCNILDIKTTVTKASLYICMPTQYQLRPQGGEGLGPKIMLSLSDSSTVCVKT